MKDLIYPEPGRGDAAYFVMHPDAKVVWLTVDDFSVRISRPANYNGGGIQVELYRLGREDVVDFGSLRIPGKI
jgi:hypothetical protein